MTFSQHKSWLFTSPITLACNTAAAPPPFAPCAVQQAFEELVLKILETPALVNAALGSGGVKLNTQAQPQASTCSC